MLCLLFHFLFVNPGATLGGAVVHLDFVRLPVDFWIVFAQPGVPQDELHFPEFCDGELHALRVVLVVEYEIDHTTDSARFVCSSIDIIHRNRACKSAEGESVLMHVLRVDEHASSAAVE